MRALAHRGSVIAVGFAIDRALLGEAEARARVLALWAPGAIVRDAGDVWVIAPLRATRVRAELAPGAPLVVQHGVAAAMPLDADEAGGLGEIAIARAGVAVSVDGAPSLDVGAWIDLDDVAIVEVQPLAPPPARIVVATPTDDVRAIAGVGAAVAAAASFAAALAASGGVEAERPPSRWSRMRAWLAARIAPAAATAAAAPAAPGAAAAPAAASTALAPPRPSWLSRLRARLALALWNSRLGETLGRRHADYLRRLLDMFDRGELDQALRHAIPLGGGDGNGGSALALATPRPRRDLRLPLGPSTPRSSIPVTASATQLIRDRYRAALARLEQDGRIDDAAFVLAELLGDVAGAIALLERHGRFALAARLAEARGQPPGLIVRLWWLAGDRAQAIAAARRHRAWADALERLESARDPRAGALRLAFAEHLADAGDYLQAVEVAWSLDDAPGLDDWIERGIAGDGIAAARLRVKQLVRAPARFAELAPALVALLDDDGDPDAPWRRLALIDTLLAHPATPETRAIARPAVRALIADVGRGADGEAPALLPRLVRFSDDAALRADQPTIAASPRAPALADRETPLTLVWDASDAGTLPVHDVAMLPGGRVLIALGELGVRLVGGDGRTRWRVDHPATRLVVSDHSTRALALIRRGAVQHLTRLDLAARRAAAWCDAACDDGAASYDGALWLTSRDGEVLAIDTTAARFTATWGVSPELGPLTIRRDGDRAAVIGADEAWFYQHLTLRKRMAHPPLPPGVGLAATSARPTAEDWVDVVASATGVQLTVERARVALPAAMPLALEADSRLVAIAQPGTAGVEIVVVHVARGRVIASLMLGGATSASLRLDDGALAIGDDRGRALVVDLRAGVLRRDLRTQP